MRKNIWKPDPDEAMKLIQEYPGGVEAFIQRAFQLLTEEQRRRAIQLLQQDGKKKRENG